MSNIYCGPAPIPASLVSAWNLDMTAIALCASIAFLHVTLELRERRPAALAAVAILGFLFLSPLCALTAALFSARALHHVMLVALAAPLLAVAFPSRDHHATVGVGWIAILHAALFWLWHAPPVYTWAISNPAAYWLMQGSLLGSGVWLWRQVFNAREGIGAVLCALLGTVIHMGMLGALLSFASTPLYEPHFLTTFAFGLTPLEDQQLAGLIMWVPAAAPYLAAALYRAWPMIEADSPVMDASRRQL